MYCILLILFFFFFFFNDTATTEIYTLSLHDALPIYLHEKPEPPLVTHIHAVVFTIWLLIMTDRKSTRLNSSHSSISYAVFCLKKKKKHNTTQNQTAQNTTPLTHYINVIPSFPNSYTT